MIDILTLVYIAIFAPFLCALILSVCKFANSKFPQYGNFALSMTTCGASLLISVLLFVYTLTYSGYVLENNIALCAIQNILFHFGIYLDNLSSIFILFISLLFFVANIFSYRYLLQNRQGFARFYIYLNLMQFFAYCFFISSNLMQSIVFIMMQSLMLYLFTNFYFQKPAAAEDSQKVFIANIAGDFILICACCAFLYFSTITADTINIPTLGYNNINSLGLYSFASLNPVIFALICLLFILGSIIKSAQYPFLRSISRSVQAPNPAFSLIISPIILAQGVFLLLRLFPLLNLTPVLFEVLKAAGILSALLVLLSAAKENEIKSFCAKIAISQTGIAIFALGFKMYDLCIFQLLCSGFAMALISYTTNALSYSTGSQENIKFLGGLREKLPFQAAAYLLGAVSLAGFVFSGFYPRAMILDKLFKSDSFIYLVILLLCSFVTAFCLFRVYFRVFEGRYRGTFEPKNVGKAMNFGIILLTLPTVFFGYIFSRYAGGFLTPAAGSNIGNFNPFINIFAFLISAAGYYLAYNIYFTKRLYSVRIRAIRRLAAKCFYAENFVDFITKDLLIFLSKIFSFFEKYILTFLYKLPAYILDLISYIAIKTEGKNTNSKFFGIVLWMSLITFIACLIYFKTGVIR